MFVDRHQLSDRSAVDAPAGVPLGVGGVEHLSAAGPWGAGVRGLLSWFGRSALPGNDPDCDRRVAGVDVPGVAGSGTAGASVAASTTFRTQAAGVRARGGGRRSVSEAAVVSADRL